jgi:hypothetical protein
MFLCFSLLFFFSLFAADADKPSKRKQKQTRGPLERTPSISSPHHHSTLLRHTSHSNNTNAVTQDAGQGKERGTKSGARPLFVFPPPFQFVGSARAHL